MAENRDNDIVLAVRFAPKVDAGDMQRMAQAFTGPIEAALAASLARQKAEYDKVAKGVGEGAGKQAAIIVAAAKQEEKARADAARAAKKADDEIQKMGRLMSSALAENARRDQKAADDFAAAEKRKAREAQIAANAVKNSWRRTMEDLENLTVVATGAWGVISGGYGRFKQLGDEVIRTSQIFGSLTGSIEAARVATGGSVADIDLIASKNRALELDLKLTDEQFGLVAAAADKFADSIGTNGTDAMNQLIQGLADARLKTLAHAGVVIDAEKAHQDYAKAIAKTVDALTDEEKKHAIQITALERMDAKFSGSQETVATFGSELEKIFVAVKNTWDRTLAAIGNAKMPKMFEGDESLADQGETYEPEGMNDPASLARKARNASIRAARVARQKRIDAERAARMNAMGSEAGLSAFGGEMMSTSDMYQRGAGEVDAFGRATKAGENTAGRTSRGKTAASNNPYDFLGDAERALAARADRERLQMEAAYADALALIGAPTEGLAEVETQRALQPKFLGQSWTGEEQDKFATAQGAGVRSQDGLTADEEKIRAQMELVGREVKTIEGATTQEGPGLIEMMMFGPEGSPQVLYDKMTEAQQVVFTASQAMQQSMQAAGDGLANALGSSLAAALGENKNFKAVLKEQTHALLMAISTQAYVKALWYGASAVGKFADGDFAAATAALIASGKFFALGTLAGVGARATMSSSGGAANTGNTPASTRSPSTDNAKSGNSERRGPESIVLNIYSPLSTDPAAVGAAMDEAFHRYRKQTGREIGEKR